MAVTAITYDGGVSRWEPNARGRLEQAALELFRERGFEQATAAEIAARAGLAERTFFRHFADKREVLFGGAGELQELLVQKVADAPDSLAPIDAVAAAFEAAGAVFQQRREIALCIAHARTRLQSSGCMRADTRSNTVPPYSYV